MISAAQILYLTEVLGVSPASYRSSRPAAAPAENAHAGATPGPAAQTLDVVAITGPLTEPLRELLQRILASVQISDVKLFDSLSALPQDAPVRHLLLFTAEAPAAPSGKIWQLPPLNEMLPEHPQMAARKKQAWTVLQQFAKELRA